MRRCDVLVVGAGLAGLWTARLLAEAGLTTPQFECIEVDGPACAER